MTEIQGLSTICNATTKIQDSQGIRDDNKTVDYLWHLTTRISQPGICESDLCSKELSLDNNLQH